MKGYITELDGVKILTLPLNKIKRLAEPDLFALYLEAYMEKYGSTDLEVIAKDFENYKNWNK